MKSEHQAQIKILSFPIKITKLFKQSLRHLLVVREEVHFCRKKVLFQTRLKVKFKFKNLNKLLNCNSNNNNNKETLICKITNKNSLRK
jgi:hypothetical protein